MITGKELKEGMVDVEKEYHFISFSVDCIREDLSYAWAFAPENEDNLGNPDVIVSNLWIQEAIEDVQGWFSWEYDSGTSIQEEIVREVVERTEKELKTKVRMVSGVLANDSIRGGNNAS